LTALLFTTPWCCSRDSGPGFLRHFFAGLFFYQDAKTRDLYYNTPDDSPDTRIKVLLPQKEKRKARDKHRTPDERRSLISRLVAWRHDAHTRDPLAAVTPPTFIIDDASTVALAKKNITRSEQVTVILDQTLEWEGEWSKQIFGVIHQFDQDLLALRETSATQNKNQQKRMKFTQDALSFDEASKENEERARLKAVQQFALLQSSSTNVRVLQTSTINNQV